MKNIIYTLFILMPSLIFSLEVAIIGDYFAFWHLDDTYAIDRTLNNPRYIFLAEESDIQSLLDLNEFDVVIILIAGNPLMQRSVQEIKMRIESVITSALFHQCKILLGVTEIEACLSCKNQEYIQHYNLMFQEFRNENVKTFPFLTINRQYDSENVPQKPLIKNIKKAFKNL